MQDFPHAQTDGKNGLASEIRVHDVLDAFDRFFNIDHFESVQSGPCHYRLYPALPPLLHLGGEFHFQLFPKRKFPFAQTAVDHEIPIAHVFRDRGHLYRKTVAFEVIDDVFT